MFSSLVCVLENGHISQIRLSFFATIRIPDCEYGMVSLSIEGTLKDRERTTRAKALAAMNAKSMMKHTYQWPKCETTYLNYGVSKFPLRFFFFFFEEEKENSINVKNQLFVIREISHSDDGLY